MTPLDEQNATDPQRRGEPPTPGRPLRPAPGEPQPQGPHRAHAYIPSSAPTGPIPTIGDEQAAAAIDERDAEAPEADDGGADRRRIVVGVSASSGSPMALRWAWEMAQSRGAQLIAVRAFKPTTMSGSAHPTPSTPARLSVSAQAMEDDAHDSLRDAVVAAIGGEAAEKVELAVVRGGRRRVLIRASDTADLLVIDAPREREFSSDPVFARSLLYNARCPVVVMPPSVAGTPWPRWLAPIMPGKRH